MSDFAQQKRGSRRLKSNRFVSPMRDDASGSFFKRYTRPERTQKQDERTQVTTDF